MKQDMITYIFGDIPLWKVGLNILLGAIGLLIPYMYKTMKRNPFDRRTPFKFSLKFFVADNLASIIPKMFFLVILIVIVAPQFEIKLDPWMCLLIGFGLPLIVNYGMDNLPSLIQKFLPSLNTSKTDYKMTTEYVFKIPVGATAIKLNGVNETIEAAAEQLAAVITDNEFVIQQSTPDTLEFIVGGVSEFVGHVPRPK